MVISKNIKILALLTSAKELKKIIFNTLNVVKSFTSHVITSLNEFFYNFFLLESLSNVRTIQ